MSTEPGWIQEWREYMRCFADVLGGISHADTAQRYNLHQLRHYRTPTTTATRALDVANDNHRSKPAPVFHQFNLLPAELRIKIWKHAYPEIRTGLVELYYSLFATKYATNFAVRPTQVLPIMLSCREAFSVMDRCYFPQNQVIMDSKNSILYLNSDINHWGFLTRNLAKKLVLQVEAIAVNVSVWIDSYATKLVKDLRAFPRLKALYLIRQDAQAWNWGSIARLGEKDESSKICDITRAVLNAEMKPFPELKEVMASGFDVYFVDRSK